MNFPALDWIVWPLVGIVIFFLIDSLLPFVACRLNSRLAAALSPNRTDLDFGWHSRIPQPVLNLLKKRLVEAGYRDQNQLNTYMLVLLLPMPSLVLIAPLLGSPLWKTALTGLWIAVMVNGWLGQRILKRKRAFQISLYKIYRFLDLQLTAGVKALDVLKGLADTIDQPLIKPDFQRFCAQLELTLDLDRALQELESSFSGPDMNLLAAQLRNSMQTGVVGHTYLRMENLMFNRHIALIQARSKQLRTWLLLVGLLALVPIEILFVYPLIAQAIQAVGHVFGP